MSIPIRTEVVTFCDVPFREIHTNPSGAVRVCCFVNTPIGNFNQDSLQNIWVSSFASEVRESILDQTYRHCDKRMCAIAASASPDNLEKDGAREEIDRLRTQFLENLELQRVALQHDESCNLSCPSCRPEMLYASKERQEQMIEIQDAWLAGPTLRNAHHVTVSANGDPFASNVYLDLLGKITREQFPKLRLSILTNGLLLTPRRWESLSNIHYAVHTILVSIDAATAETYAIVRRGGVFTKLLANLDFIAQLHRSQRVKNFCIKFVISAQNFQEMPAFVRLGKELGCSQVKFQYIDQFGHMGAREYNDASVHHIQHPEHAALLDVLGDPIFDDPIVHMMNPHAIHNDNVLEPLIHLVDDQPPPVDEPPPRSKRRIVVDNLKQLVIRNSPKPLVWALRVPYRIAVGRAPFAPPMLGDPVENTTDDGEDISARPR